MGKRVGEILSLWRYPVRSMRGEQLESVDVTHERLAAQREVVDVVLALKDPYRSVILLRYYQDLSPTEIAERLPHACRCAVC